MKKKAQLRDDVRYLLYTCGRREGANVEGRELGHSWIGSKRINSGSGHGTQDYLNCIYDTRTWMSRGSPYQFQYLDCPKRRLYGLSFTSVGTLFWQGPHAINITIKPSGFVRLCSNGKKKNGKHSRSNHELWFKKISLCDKTFVSENLSHTHYV